MSINQLKTLVTSVCSSGSISDSDKNMLQQKAIELGIPLQQLEVLIMETLSSQASPANLSSGFVSAAETENTNENLSSGFMSSPAEIHTTKKTPPEQNPQTHFTDVMLLSNQGAMSIVQKAKLHGKWVIIKRIRPEFRNNPTYVDLFYKEFENAYHLDHPNIIRLLDKGDDADGAYYSMEFVDGRSLTELIQPGGMKDYKLIKRTAIQLVDALIYVHRKQVYHRDLKPDNILLTYKGNNVKVLDFGLAAADSFDDDLIKVGTPKYAAPEQMSKGNQVDQRADIYAVGLILLEMLTGTTDKNAISKIEIPEYAAIIDKATQQQPENRYDDCDDILPLLRNLPEKAPEKAISTPPPPPVKEIKKPQQKETVVAQTPKSKSKKNPLPLILAIVVLVAVGGGIWFFKDSLFGSKTQDNNKDNTAGNDTEVVENEDAKNEENSTVEDNTTTFDQAKYDQIKKIADQLFADKNIVNAKKQYEELQKIAPSDTYANEQLAKCEEIMQHDLFKVKRDPSSGKFGYTDKLGNLIVGYIFDRAEYFYSLYAAPVKKDGLWGFINKKGELIEPYKYTSFKTFKRSGVPAYRVTKNGTTHAVVPQKDGTIKIY